MNVASDRYNDCWDCTYAHLGESENFFTCNKDGCTLLGENIALFCCCMEVQICLKGCIQKLTFQKVGLCPFSTYCLSSKSTSLPALQ